MSTNPKNTRSAAQALTKSKYAAHLCAVLLMVTFAPSTKAAEKQQPYQISYISPGTCTTTDGLESCARKIEAHALHTTENVITRDDRSLCLPIQGQATQCYAHLDSVRYAFAGIFFNDYLVLEIHDENWEVLLISGKNGHEIRLPSYPVTNPSKSAFATVSFDVDAGYTPNIIQIWAIPAEDKPALEINQFPLGQGPAAISWISDSELHADLADIDGILRGNLIAEHSATGWSVRKLEATEM